MVRIVATIVGAVLLVSGSLLITSCNEAIPLYTLGAAALLLTSATFLSIGLGISVFLLEVLVGITASVLGLRVSEPLHILSLLGSLLILFTLGLEVNVRLLLPVMKHNIKQLMLIISTPIIITYIIFYHMLHLEFVDALVASLALSSSATPITYRLVKDLGILSTSRGLSLIATSLLMEITSIVLVSITIHGLSLYVIAYPLLVIFVITLLPRVIDKAMRYFRVRVEYELEVKLILSTLLPLAVVSVVLGIEASLIAFILGISISEVVRIREDLLVKLRGLTYGFLAPIFYFVTGLRYIPQITPHVLVVTLLVPLVLIISKVLISFIVCLGGYPRGKFREYVALLPNLTMAAIIATLGLEAGVLDLSTYSLIIQSAVVTTLVAALIIRELPGVST